MVPVAMSSRGTGAMSTQSWANRREQRQFSKPFSGSNMAMRAPCSVLITPKPPFHSVILIYCPVCLTLYLRNRLVHRKVYSLLSKGQDVEAKPHWFFFSPNSIISESPLGPGYQFPKQILVHDSGVSKQLSEWTRGGARKSLLFSSGAVLTLLRHLMDVWEAAMDLM